MPDHRQHWSTRLFGILLGLYPAGFRDEYGREMTLAFRDRYRNASGTIDRIVIWLEALVGLIREAPKEHGRVILRDVLYAARTLRRNALFSCTIVLTLALGIGANSAMFSLLNSVVLRTLPVPNPDELSVVRIESRIGAPQRFSWPMFTTLRAALPQGSIGAMSRVAQLHTQLGQSADTERAGVQLVSGEYFQVLDVQTFIGRPLSSQDNVTPGAHPVAVISYGYWQRQFGGAADILGRELLLNGVRFTIIGVGPKGFSGVWLESPADVWIPLAMQNDVRYAQNYSADSAETRKPWMPQERIWWLDMVVRTVNPATTTNALNTVFLQQLNRIAESISDPEQRRLGLQQRLILEPFGAGFSILRQRFTKPLYVLLAMAGLVLLIACANAANLLLARSAGRSREIAVRQSLGAGRLRLVQQLITEGLLLVGAAAALATVLARWSGDILVRMATAPESGPAPFQVVMDSRVLAFTALLALATGLLFALAPALRSTRLDLTESLKAASRNVSLGLGTTNARVLVALQIALSLVLVSGTALLGRSFEKLLRLDMGFEQEKVLSIPIDPDLGRYTAEQRFQLHQRLIERLEAMPGVQSVGLAMCGIVNGCRSFSDGINFEGYQSAPRERAGFLTNVVSRSYFASVGMRLVAGRSFSEADRTNSPNVAVVNEALARRYFAGRAVGKRFGDQRLDTQIIGVIADARVQNVKDAAEPMAYFSLDQHPISARSVEVRTVGDPRQVTAAIRQAITEVAPRLPVSRVTALAERISRNLSQERLILSLTSAFGILALGLASFGLFGILSYAVERRRPELGIRIALGASQRRVIWDVVREALLLILAGLAIGFPAVLAGSKLMTAMLFEVSPHDWTALTAATAVLVVVPLLAALLPGWRASRVDPIVALRQE